MRLNRMHEVSRRPGGQEASRVLHEEWHSGSSRTAETDWPTSMKSCVRLLRTQTQKQVPPSPPLRSLVGVKTRQHAGQWAGQGSAMRSDACYKYNTQQKRIQVSKCMHACINQIAAHTCWHVPNRIIAAVFPQKHLTASFGGRPCQEARGPRPARARTGAQPHASQTLVARRTPAHRGAKPTGAERWKMSTACLGWVPWWAVAPPIHQRA